MRLANENELLNTRSKLSALEALIRKKETSPTESPARELSLESMRRMAGKLRSEIEEYERAHQTT